jgi:hypothetical protein
LERRYQPSADAAALHHWRQAGQLTIINLPTWQTNPENPEKIGC